VLDGSEPRALERDLFLRVAPVPHRLVVPGVAKGVDMGGGDAVIVDPVIVGGEAARPARVSPHEVMGRKRIVRSRILRERPAERDAAPAAHQPGRRGAVEVGGLRCTGRCLPLRAFENRVYEVELEDERRLVVKFYRPGRWSRETILDEHAFLADLTAAEVPAVAPIDIGTGATLSEIEGIYYAAFPKVRGRSLDELDAENRRRIGRTIGRMHAVGASRDAPHRPRGDVKRYIAEPLEVLMAGSFI